MQEVVPFLSGVNSVVNAPLMRDFFGTAINSTGELIGNANTTGFNGTPQGFSWQFNPTGVAPDPKIIPNINGFTGLTPTNLNNSGQIVGFSTGPNNLVHAFLSDGQSTIDLNSLIPPTSGLNLYAAAQIGDAGQVVGLATDRAGNIHEFELIPTTAPEPSALACLLVGSLAMAALRRPIHRKPD